MNRRSLCILLCLLLAFGQTLAIFAEQAQRPTTQPTAAEQQMAELEAELELSQLPIYDRYIVKLKPTNSLAAANTTLNTAVEAAIPAAKQAANTQVQAVLDAVQADETEAFDLAETPAYTVEPQSAELLTVTLTEKVDAAAFTAELSENAQIEYIQPDYTLELASDVVLDLDLSELTPAGTATPAVTAEPTPEVTSAPEIDLEITPEQTTAPEATLDPEIQPTPGTEPAPTPTAAPVVAVIDSGIDVAHHGLIEQMLPGYDFVNNTELVYDSSKKDEYYHGTHVAGIIAQNAPTAQILPLKVFEHGRAYTSDIIRAIEYAQEHGASVVNMSFGGTKYNFALLETLEQSDLLFVCAAGNSRTDTERSPVYPACFDLENIISVASLNQDLGFSYYSNYGTESVDIAAVGRDVYSMWPEGAYGEMSGTSQAAAQVSAGAAEALARGDADAKAAVLERADKYTHLMNKVADGRSLNLFNVSAGAVSEGVQTVAYEDDFDVHGYQPTPEENWELFSSVPNVQVVAQYDKSYALKNDGTVWAWGNNDYGYLGIGKDNETGAPMLMPGLTGIISIECGHDFGIALKADGTLWYWGKTRPGSVDGVINDVPMQVTGLQGIQDIWAFYNTVFYKKQDGSLWGFGSNVYGNLGDGTDEVRIDPVQINGLENIADIYGLSQATYFIHQDGTVSATGKGFYTGTGTAGDSLIPVQVNGLSNIKSISEDYILKKDNTVWKISDNTLTQISDLDNTAYIFSHGTTFAIKNDGTVWAWGNNSYGQLGDGTYNAKSTPEQIDELYGMSQIVCNSTHSIGIKDNDGIVYTWGSNGWGQLGRPEGNSYGKRLTPYKVNNLEYMVDIAAGLSHVLAVREDGVVYGWGNNSFGQLGNGTTESTSVPVQVNSISDATMVACGAGFSLVLKEDGTVWATGDNSYNQLNDSSLESSQSFIKITSLSDIVFISAGNRHALALDKDGVVWSWGDNSSGQLGTGAFYQPYHPVQVQTGDFRVVDIQAVDNQSFAVLSNGLVMGWGDSVSTPTIQTGINTAKKFNNGSHHQLLVAQDGTAWVRGQNSSGQFGNGMTSFNYVSTPVQIGNLQNVKDVSGYDDTAILQENGDLWMCGFNMRGVIGNGTHADQLTLYKTMTNVKKVEAAEFYTVALKKDGTVWTWGENGGKLGDGVLIDSPTPESTVISVGDYQPSTIAAGNGHSLIIDENGGILASGRGTHGQLGNGERVSSEMPVRVKDSTGTGYFTGAKAVAAGFLFSLALKEDGTLWTWGNATGFMTDTGDSHSDIPVQVVDENGQPLTDIVDISALGAHWLALDSQGNVWAWGANESGQLGNETTENVYTHAVKVPNLTGINQIAAGAYHSLAIRADDSLWAWGKNDNGQLGNQQTTNSSIPVQVLGVSNLKGIAAGEFHSMVLKHDGTVWSWGRNQYGQLGDGTRNSSLIPVQVKNESGVGFLEEIIHIDAGNGYSMAVTEYETLYGWGHNYAYQLGNNTQQSSNLPTAMREELNRDLITFVKEVSCGSTTTLVRTNSSVYICGTNTYGEFGNGTLKSHSALPTPAFTGTAEPLRITAEFQSGGTALDSLAPGAVTCNASIQNNQYIHRNALLVMKLWNKQTLVMEDVSMQPIAVPVADFVTQSYEFTIPSDAQNYQIELMVIDSMDNLDLLSNVVIFE